MNQFITDNQLPEDYQKAIDTYFIPLVNKVITKYFTPLFLKSQNKTEKTLIIGVSGPQGSGKSTLSDCLAQLFQARKFNTQVLSLDDFYLTKRQRTTLANKIHPLFVTRGVPGTHDTELLLNTLIKLKKTSSKKTSQIERLYVPTFNKLRDDRDVPRKINPCDIILLEGWCVGWEQPYHESNTPINQLEKKEDSQKLWRNHIASQSKKYSVIWQMLDTLIYLKIPNFSMIYKWRKLQEDKLAQKYLESGTTNLAMNTEQLNRFIQHYERITRNLMQQLLSRAEFILDIDSEHRFTQLTLN